ncbi:hypothetical protein SDC9_153405 [bioreactor metagenome]|uniref:Uncharacterized protein n=1 Tax=bioreactor metagenome TaxID=1076179 RepID=A0A645EY99_9ZZZZ
MLNSNYIQIQCKLSGYIALFNFQTTAAFRQLLILAVASRPTRSGMKFNLASFPTLSTSDSNFFRFSFSPAPPPGIPSSFGDVLFKIPRFSELSNPGPNFFRFFLFNNPASAPRIAPQSATWGLTYHDFRICQPFFRTFFRFSVNSATSNRIRPGRRAF